MYFGKTFKFHRKKIGLTQQEVADALLISQKSYSNIENNRCDIRLKKFLRLSLVLGFHPADFFKDTSVYINQALDKQESLFVENLYLKKEINHYKALLQDKKNIINLLKKHGAIKKTVKS